MSAVVFSPDRSEGAGVPAGAQQDLVSVSLIQVTLEVALASLSIVLFEARSLREESPQRC